MDDKETKYAEILSTVKDIELVIELLSNNPLTSHRTETIISNFKEEAQRILDGKTKDN